MSNRWRWLDFILAGYWTLIFVGTHLPMAPSQHFNLSPIPLDKIAHFSAFGLLGLLLIASIRDIRRPIQVLLFLTAVIAAYGVLDELTQKLVPSRSADFWDWVADMLGGCTGLLVGLAIRLNAPRARIPERPHST
ncbi:MAG: VanZ family protein [Planctomycetes bacterium]|nr:VanZ family protein [Planctomycetota bacterium]